MIFNIIKMLEKKEKEEKEKVKTYLESKRDKIIFHLVCCYALNNSTNNYNHWKDEIYGILKQVPKFSGTNKYPTYNQLYKWDLIRWSDSLYDHLRGYINEVERKESTKLDLDRQELSNFILDYYKWLYHEFEIDGTVTLDEVYDFIDYLMKKYNRSYLL